MACIAISDIMWLKRNLALLSFPLLRTSNRPKPPASTPFSPGNTNSMSDYNSVPPAGAGGPLGVGIKKDAFADAVQRARQIAAKIGGDVGAAPLNNTGVPESFPFTAQKRQLEDADQPDSKKMAPQIERDPGPAMSSIGATLAAMAQRPSSMTEDYRVPDGMVGLIIGRGGEQINKIQQDSGCKVQIAPDSGGLPERTVSLTGNPDAIQKAKMFLDEIVSRGRGTPPSSFHESTNGQSGSMQEMMIPAGKAGLIIGKGGETIKQLQERAGVKMILIQDGSQAPNMDKPLRIIGEPYKVQQARELVQEILRERDHPGFGDRNEYGSRMGRRRRRRRRRRRWRWRWRRRRRRRWPRRRRQRRRRRWPRRRQRRRRRRHRCARPTSLRYSSNQMMAWALTKWPISWDPPECCEHAASIINDLLQSIRVREEGQGGPPGPPGSGMPPGGGRGRGRGPGRGPSWRSPRQPPPNGDPNFKLFIIRGSPQQIDHAKQLIEDKIEGPLCPVGPGPGGPGPSGPMGPYNPNPYNHGPPGGPPHGGPPGGHQCPPQGWGGTYQQWQPPGPHDPNKAAAADPNAAWAAYYAQYYQQPGGAMPGQAPSAPAGAPAPGAEQSQAGQAPGGQPDYTKAWEEYYKKMAQAGGPAAGQAAAAAAAAPASGGAQPDYSAAWAEYYRQQAAYYGQPGQTAGQPVAPQQGQQTQ
ncbi:hypothetical protein SKAU_G00119160 [Synaphobranchus kaupii]|uniref:K Homology domain-containing protein n=1 Tax=Synaphobranchus kaupii TaxID=118154 RepID=A0A9Q1FN88_SYNKA|nr:hypothetical protein SKAU_G00119160 [Synaphobranchus kaupii]